MERKKSLNFINSDKIIKPQHAVQRLYELTKDQRYFYYNRSRSASNVGSSTL